MKWPDWLLVAGLLVGLTGLVWDVVVWMNRGPAESRDLWGRDGGTP